MVYDFMEIVNVLPCSPIEKGIAAFPDELAYRCIILFSYIGDTVLDPFCGSGTTMKMARELGRNSIGIEIKKSLLPIIKTKIGFNGQAGLLNHEDIYECVIRDREKYGCIC